MQWSTNSGATYSLPCRASTSSSGKWGQKRQLLPKAVVKTKRVDPCKALHILTSKPRPFTEEDTEAQKRQRQRWIWNETSGP